MTILIRKFQQVLDGILCYGCNMIECLRRKKFFRRQFLAGFAKGTEPLTHWYKEDDVHNEVNSAKQLLNACHTFNEDRTSRASNESRAYCYIALNKWLAVPPIMPEKEDRASSAIIFHVLRSRETCRAVYSLLGFFVCEKPTIKSEAQN